MITLESICEDIKIKYIGIQHSIKDTESVVSYINKSDIDIAFIEKNSDLDLSQYNQQIKRIVGHLRNNNIDYKCIDQYNYESNYLYRYNKIDRISDDKNKSKLRRLRLLRKQIKNKDTDVYKELYEKREKSMIKNISNYSFEDPNLVCIIVGEAHIPKIYDQENILYL